MSWHFTPYALPIIVAVVISLGLAAAAWRRRPAPGALPFCLLMLAMAEWTLGYALELVSTSLPSVLFWDNVSWLGAVAAPALWLVFVLRYTGRAAWLDRQILALLVVEPLLTLILVWTNGSHGLIESGAHLYHVGSLSTLVVAYGVWYWVNIVYSYVLLLLGAFVVCSFVLTAARSAHLYCAQGVCLFIAVTAPWVGNAAMIFGFDPLTGLDLTAFALIISCLAFAWGLFYFGLLDIVPVAREMVIESMRDAVVALDAQNRIVDLNPAARGLVNYRTGKAVGRPFAQVFASWPELVERCRTLKEMDEEVILGEGEAPRSYSLRISPLYRQNGRPAMGGRLIVLHDMTERVLAERALKESEGRFREIFTQVPIGMALVDLEGRILQVNRAFCEMLGYSEHELAGYNFSAIVHPDDIEKDTLLAAQALHGKIPGYKVEKRYLRKNLETLWADLTSTMLRDRDGRVIYSLVMLENIIERKRARLLEEERHHVAYELHDGLAQVTVSVHQHLQAFASHYRPRSAQARQELDRALELAQLSVKEARRLIAGLRPTVLDDFGLATALRLLAEAQRGDGWTMIFDETIGSERLPPALETTLFGVAQEALTNARKHAGTTRARLALERRDTIIRLEVQDWGCGFDPDVLHHECCPGEHVGIRGMRERVELLGGRLVLTSQPGAGTMVVAEVPALPSSERSLIHEP